MFIHGSLLREKQIHFIIKWFQLKILQFDGKQLSSR